MAAFTKPEQPATDSKTMNQSAQMILQTTMLIQLEYPELSKFLEEMPVTIPDMKEPVMSPQILSDYNDSLTILLASYASLHS
jgi:hypothetical protein